MSQLTSNSIPRVLPGFSLVKVARPVIVLMLLFVIVAMPWLLGQSASGATFRITLVSILLEAIPFVVLGSIIGGVIEVFVSPQWLTRIIPRRQYLAVPVAALGGFLLPVCECAVVPVARRLLAKGVPFPAVLAYMLAAPIVNPLVIASTAVAYLGDTRMVVLRTVGGYIVAVIVPLIIRWRWRQTDSILLQHAKPNTGCGCGHTHQHGSGTCGGHGKHQRKPLSERLTEAMRHAVDDFLLVGRFLVIGALMAAIIHTALDRQIVASIGASPVFSTLAMMAMAGGLNLCSEADAFVAASLSGILAFSAQLAFLVLGPMMDIKLAAMYLAFMKRTAVAWIIALVCAGVFGFSMLTHLLIGGGS